MVLLREFISLVAIFVLLTPWAHGNTNHTGFEGSNLAYNLGSNSLSSAERQSMFSDMSCFSDSSCVMMFVNSSYIFDFPNLVINETRPLLIGLSDTMGKTWNPQSDLIELYEMGTPEFGSSPRLSCFEVDSRKVCVVGWIGFTSNALFVHVSTDGGASWSAPTIEAFDPSLNRVSLEGFDLDCYARSESNSGHADFGCVAIVLKRGAQAPVIFYSLDGAQSFQKSEGEPFDTTPPGFYDSFELTTPAIQCGKKTCLVTYCKLVFQNGARFGELAIVSRTFDGGRTFENETPLSWSVESLTTKRQRGGLAYINEHVPSISCSEFTGACHIVNSVWHYDEGDNTTSKGSKPARREIATSTNLGENWGQQRLLHAVEGGGSVAADFGKIKCFKRSLCIEAHSLASNDPVVWSISKDGGLTWGDFTSVLEADKPLVNGTLPPQERRRLLGISCPSMVGCVLSYFDQSTFSIYVTNVWNPIDVSEIELPGNASAVSTDFATPTVRYLSLSLFFTTAIVCLCCALLVCLYRKHPVVQAAQPAFLAIIIFGAFLSSSSIFFFTQESQSELNIPKDLTCMAAVWVFGMGFILMYSAMIVKMKRIRYLFALRHTLNDKDRRMISFKRNILLVAIIIAVESALLAAWQLISPLESNVNIVKDQANGNPLYRQEYCSSRYDIEFAAAIGGFHLAILLYAALIANSTSKIHSAYSEGKHIRYSVMNGLQFSIIAIPIIVISSSANTSLLMRSGAIALHDLGLLGLVFLPKLYMILWGVQGEEAKGRQVIQTQVISHTASFAHDTSETDGDITSLESHSYNRERKPSAISFLHSSSSDSEEPQSESKF